MKIVYLFLGALLVSTMGFQPCFAVRGDEDGGDVVSENKGDKSDAKKKSYMARMRSWASSAGKGIKKGAVWCKDGVVTCFGACKKLVSGGKKVTAKKTDAHTEDDEEGGIGDDPGFYGYEDDVYGSKKSKE